MEILNVGITKAARTTPQPLPKELRNLKPTAKTLWLYLNPLGLVQLSQRDLATELGLSQTIISQSFADLKDANLLVGEFELGKTSTYQAIAPNKG